MERHAKTKRSLTPSILMIVMCLALLIGTTFAWFTDTASTSVNKIEAGKLDVELYSADNTTGTEEDTTWTKITSETPALEFVKAAEDENEPVLWEPGCTYSLPALKIVNNGNLAIKYTIAISGIKGSEKLNDAIEWTMTLGSNDNKEAIGTAHILPAKPADATQESADIFTISGHMREDAGNEYQDESIDGISIVVYATQAPVEYDSSSNTYDKNASYKIPNEIKNNATLAIAAGTVTLPTSDISGNGITISGAGENETTLEVPKVGYKISGSNVTLKDLTIDGAEQAVKGSKALVLSGDDTTLENVTVNAAATSDARRATGVYIGSIDESKTVKIANSTIEIKNGIDGAKALMVQKLNGCLSIESSTLSAGSANGYCLWVTEGSGSVNAEGTTLSGNVLFGKSFKGTVIFDGCTFNKGPDTRSVVWAWANITFENCKFANGFKFDSSSTNVTVTFKNCTYKGEAVTKDNVKNILSVGSGSTVTVNETKVNLP